MQTELARFPLVSGVPQRLTWVENRDSAPTAIRRELAGSADDRHAHWNRLLGLATLLGVSAGGWSLVGVMVERMIH